MSIDDKKAKYKALIDSYFSDVEVGNKDYSFKASLKRNIAGIVKQLLEILIYYFAKYDEEYFHKRMDEHYVVTDKKTDKQWQLHGFSYIDDFKRYHKLKFLFFITTVQVNKSWFVFKEDKIVEITVAMLEVKGWQLRPHEHECIKHNVKRLYNILYHKQDTLEEL